METTTTEIADGIHRISTFAPDAGIPFNQYLVVADEPLLFHTGPRQLFPSVQLAVGRIVRPSRCAGSRSGTSSPTSAAR
jgi:hypothetical protein